MPFAYNALFRSKIRLSIVAQQYYREAADRMEAPPEVTRVLKMAGKNARLISIRLMGLIILIFRFNPFTYGEDPG